LEQFVILRVTVISHPHDDEIQLSLGSLRRSYRSWEVFT